MRRFWMRAAALVRGKALDREMAREMEAHLGLLEEEFERRGYSQEAARLAARRTYGGLEQAQELHREARSFLWVEQVLRDARNGARGLRRTPVFTAVAVLTLALGIGANTALFSVVNAVLLRPLDYGKPEQLVTVLHEGSSPVAPANYLDWRTQSLSYEALEAAEYWTPNLAVEEGAEHVVGLRTTPGLLPMLGVAPMLGRTLGDVSQREVVLSHKLWERRYGSDRGVIGRVIRLNGEPYTVAGVMPAGFRFAPFWATKAELWAPLDLRPRAQMRGGNSLRVFGRLKDGVSLEQARAEIAGLTARLEREFPGTNRGVEVSPLKEKVVGKVETPLLMLMGACGLVLLIACANVAHMLLGRTAAREREIAVRTALGAGRRRLAAQFLTENLVLAGLGAGVGVLLAAWGTAALMRLGPAQLPRLETVEMDGRVVLFLLGATLMTAVLFGLAPTLKYAAGSMSEALKEGGRAGSEGRRRGSSRRVLVVSEFALAFVLLTGAGLLLRSYVRLQSIDPGFRTEKLLTMTVSVAGTTKEGGGPRETFYRELVERAGALPGVKSASGINHLPLAGDQWGWSFLIEGQPQPLPGEAPTAVYRIAMPGYFETMGLPVLRGRGIEARDNMRSPGVVVINERAAERYWPGRDPIGQRITFTTGDGEREWLTVVGVVKDARQLEWTAKPMPEVYLAALQNRAFLGMAESRTAYITLVVKTEGDAAAMAESVKRTVWSIDRNVAVSAVQTMETVVAEATAQARFEMLLFSLFAGVALVLAAAGIYGVMSHAVEKRTREIGIRMSLGASRGAVLGMVARQTMKEALAGTVIGVSGALMLARLLGGMLYEVRPSDPATLGTVTAALLLTALLAALGPARRATRIDPTVALRGD